MDKVLKSLEQENVMIMLYTYGKLEGEIGSLDVPKSSRMIFRMKDTENTELLNLFIETALKVSKKEKSHVCYTIVKKDANAIMQVLNEHGFEKGTLETEEGILYTKTIALSQEEAAETPIPFDGIDCFVLWGTQGISYKIGKGKNVMIREFNTEEFLN